MWNWFFHAPDDDVERQGQNHTNINDQPYHSGLDGNNNNANLELKEGGDALSEKDREVGSFDDLDPMVTAAILTQVMSPGVLREMVCTM